MVRSNIIVGEGGYLNRSPIGLNSLEARIKVLSPNCYNFNKLSVLVQTIRSLYSSAYFKNVFLTIFTAVCNIKVFLIPWYTQPALKKDKVSHD